MGDLHGSVSMFSLPFVGRPKHMGNEQCPRAISEGEKILKYAPLSRNGRMLPLKMPAFTNVRKSKCSF